ncbi:MULTISPECIES: ATP-dependent Clp protease proteolytic subunit [unclassified Ensifer]|uniref:ATP-dependent Clp protease proteolytic subunit n=1 Tax=unclassified Ensifer TaxID=2633371 RepID=UPI00070E6EC3|nr:MULTISPECIES: ATP-dependent Clp protease proteolytic subunit [unclassified Ensifer]KQU83086.1 hypothetical protein ASD00_34060 [Ensifer sp. Root31]KQW59814.1 hypothetical protein ASD02_27590 [Ensifer sp. Root1252]KQY67104.1 hypothetical protein ASD52_10820 [Ensifer sp. Root142]KRC74016.1 hypothetical protein ASE32_32295 [Ensifer sp. Root231]KRC96890.1 hypothetical protein ASE47_30275 [Ensifer sp. Root258]
MRIDEGLKILARVDDGVWMRGTFFSLLAATAIFLVIDMRSLWERNAEEPIIDPARWPILLPAPGGTGRDGPPVELLSSHEVLRQPMKLELQRDGVLLAEGTFDIGAGERFVREIEQRGEYVKTVSLNSPGGSVDDALAISKLIREKGLDTRVASGALCASSCPIVFAGGVRRLAEPEAVVGVHQLSNASTDRTTADQAMSSTQLTTARITRHLEEMGIDAGLWIKALETPPDKLQYVSAQEMIDFKLTTGLSGAMKKK